MVLGLAVLVTLATLRHVYRGGTTLNDHAVALVVAGCIFVYPVLWIGLEPQRPPPWVHSFSLFLAGVGMMSIYGLFVILDRRVEAGALLPIAMVSQLAYAFALWAGLLLCIWIPAAGLARLLGLGAPSWLWPGLWLAIPAGLSIWGTAWTFLMHQTERHIRLGEGEGEASLRIVHLSDIHASPVMTGADLSEMVTRVNRMEPDLVLMTGDFVMPFSEDEHGYLIDALRELNSPAMACPGNHDLPVLETLGEELEAIGIRWLVDTSVVVQFRGHRLEVAGVNFHWKGARAALEAALEAMPRPEADHRILLAHDPRLFDWLPEDRFDLQLSGHTHGGQVGTDMFGIPWSVLRPLGVYDQGLFQRGQTTLYVHRGNWHTGLPPRMGIASEIVLIELASKASDDSADSV